MPAHLLDSIESRRDLLEIPVEQLPQLAQQIRQRLIESLAQTGGHLGPNLGVVELSIAMHRVFETPKDKFVFDVSHQGYVHKMLTGRLKQMHTIRQGGGLCGFFNRSESVHDAFGAGHAGTALSAALGMAAARDLAGERNHVVALAGDAAFTCGVTLEALNNIAATTKRFMVILNDNEWSIDRNVGALAKYFNSLQSHDTYTWLRAKAADFAEKVGGKAARNFVHKVENSAKGLMVPSVLFEKFGLRYYGPIDGHDLPLMIKTLEYLKQQEEPVILHVITEKGRGYQPAIENPGKFHGLGQYNIKDGATPSPSIPTYSEVFANTVTNMAKKDKSIVAITAAMPGGTKLEIFKKALPERYFDTGIAEEHAALFAAGMACENVRPFLAIYSTFMQRAYDMLVHDIALQSLPVRLCMDRAGLSSDDGPTHHGLFDIAYIRSIPGMIGMQPRDEAEFVHMLHTMQHYDKGPIAVRYPRGSGVGVPLPEQGQILEIGKAEVVKQGSGIALLALGNMFELAEQIHAKLEQQGIQASLVNARFYKPIDGKCIEQLAACSKVILTLEDHAECGGFGAAVMEYVCEKQLDVAVERIAWPDNFVEHGKLEHLRRQHAISVEAAMQKLSAYL